MGGAIRAPSQTPATLHGTVPSCSPRPIPGSSLLAHHLPCQCIGCCFCRSRWLPPTPGLPSWPESGHRRLSGRKGLLSGPQGPPHSKWLPPHPSGQMHLLQSIRSTFQGLCVRPSSCPLFWVIQLMGIPGSSVSVPSWVPPWAWGPLRPCFQDSCCRATFPRRAEGWDRRAVYQGPSVTRPSLRLPLTSRLTGEEVETCGGSVTP